MNIISQRRMAVLLPQGGGIIKDMRSRQSIITTKPERLLFTILIFLAFAAGIYFRAVNLRQSPGWYSDEGNHIDQAENWMQGKWQNYDVLGAPYIQRLPLYMYAISIAMNVFGVDIIVTRGLSAVANLICAALIGWIAWKKLGRTVGVLTVWVMAIAPWMVAFGRLGLTYNLMAPFFLFSLIAIYLYCLNASPVWLVTAAVSSALAFATDYLGILCAVTIGLVLLVKRPRSIGWFILIFLAAMILVLLPVLLVNARTFFTDLGNQFLSRGMAKSSPSSLLSILLNYNELLRQESWILVGICGLFLIKDKLLRNIFLTAVGLTLLLVTRTYVPVGVGLHYLMHLFPLFALGLAVFLLSAYKFIKHLFTSQLTPVLARFPKLPAHLSTMIAALIVFNSLVWMFLGSFSMTVYGVNFLFTDNDNMYLLDVQPADQVRAYVASQVNADDLVLGSPALIWGLPTMHRADFMTALAYDNQDPHKFLNVEKSRFIYQPSLQKTKFVILDPLAEEFAPKVLPGMDAWLEEIHTWPVVYEAGEIKVYLNENN